jgi:hypothetical protein
MTVTDRIEVNPKVMLGNDSENLELAVEFCQQVKQRPGVKKGILRIRLCFPIVSIRNLTPKYARAFHQIPVFKNG